jgi:hypothetical protein
LRGVVTAQANFAETTSQADGRTTVEGQALTATDTSHGAAGSLVVGVGSSATAVVVGHAGFQPEAGGHATAEVFRTTEAQTAAVVAGVGQLGLVGRTDAAAVTNSQRGVNDTEQGDGRLGRSHASGRQHSQSNQGLFHCKFLQG